MQDRQTLRKRIKAAEKDYQRRHQSLNERIEQLQREQKIHEQQVDDYQQRQRDFKAKVERWSRGQAKRHEISRDELLATEQNLREQAEKLNQRARKINAYARRLRREQRQLSALHEALNTQIDRFNRSSELFSGFQAGLYEGRGRIGTITIFQFQDERQLRTIIAHELGHALGIGHVPGSDSIMHKHMSDKNRYPTSLSTHDLDALREQCRISAPPRANARRAKPRQNPLPKGPE
jgi:chromosome segregation ATPase